MDKEMKKPCPRLEFEWFKDYGIHDKRKCIYSLVIPLTEYDIRRYDSDGNEVRDELKLEIGVTDISGGKDWPPISEGKVDTPFRDGAHAEWDREALGGHIPIVAVCGDEFTIIEE